MRNASLIRVKPLALENSCASAVSKEQAQVDEKENRTMSLFCNLMG